MVEVQLRPGVSGCLMVPLACLSLGLIPLLMRWGARHFARRMDEFGIETRGGKRIAWNEFTRIKRAQQTLRPGMHGALLRPTVSDDLFAPTSHALSDEYLLESPKGRVSVPFWRVINANEVRAYTVAHVPPHLLPRPK